MKAVAFVLAVLLVSSSVLTVKARAAEESDEQTTSVSTEERAKVKKRLYPGGRDEDSLQVQSQLTTPTKEGAADEPADPADHD